MYYTEPITYWAFELMQSNTSIADLYLVLCYLLSSSLFTSCIQHYYADNTQVYLSFWTAVSTSLLLPLFSICLLVMMPVAHILRINVATLKVPLLGKNSDSLFAGVCVPSVSVNEHLPSLCSSYRGLGLIMDKRFHYTNHIFRCFIYVISALHLSPS